MTWKPPPPPKGTNWQMDNCNWDEHEAEELFHMYWLSCPAASGVFLALCCHLMQTEGCTGLKQHRNAFTRRHGGTEIIAQRARSQCAVLNLPCIVNRQFLHDKSTGSIVLLTYYSGLATRIITKTGYVIREENNLSFVLRPQALHPSSSSQQAQWFHLHRARVSAICPPYWWGGLEKDWTKQGLSPSTSQREAWTGTQQAASTSTTSQESVRAKNSKRSSF